MGGRGGHIQHGWKRRASLSWMGEEGIFIIGGKEGHIQHGWEKRTYFLWVGERDIFTMGGRGGHIQLGHQGQTEEIRCDMWASGVNWGHLVITIRAKQGHHGETGMLRGIVGIRDKLGTPYHHIIVKWGRQGASKPYQSEPGTSGAIQRQQGQSVCIRGDLGTPCH